MTDDMLGPSPMHIKYSSYDTTDFAYDGPIFLVPLSPSYPSSPVCVKISLNISIFSVVKIFNPPKLEFCLYP